MTSPKRLISATLLAACIGLCGTAFAAEPDEPKNSDLNRELFYQLLLSEIYANSGEIGDAYLGMLDAARKANSAKLYERAVEMALRARSGESALDAARAWQRAFPASKDANRYVLQILLGLNRVSDTLEPLKKELVGTTGKERITAIDLLPRYFSRVTDKPLAANIVEQVLATDLTSPETGPAAWSAVGLLRLNAGSVPGGLEAAQRGAALNARAEEPAVLALNLMEAKSPGAEALVQRYLAGQPLPEVRMAYARRLIDTMRYSEALVQMQTLNTQAPSFADAWLVRGSLELQDRNNVAAESSLKQYTQLVAPNEAPAADGNETSRGMVQAYLLLAQIAEQRGQLDEANAYLQRINSPQDTLKVLTRRAMILAGQGKMAEARALIRSAPETQAEDARAKISAEVQLLRDHKQLDTAYQVLAAALKQYPDDTNLMYDQAMIAEKLGKLDDMEKLLRQVIAASPDYHHAYNALGYSLADRNVRLPEARKLIEKALEFAPNDPFIVDSLAWVEFRSGNAAEAKRLLEQAYASRQDAEIAAHLGEVLWSLGQRDQANTIWGQALQQQKDNETLQETVRRLRAKP
ncbi:tetratricopeptide repeat protein [Rhodoferax saidenbachensis]|uniref:Flp pilus assembly protein TadD n=1 Tax=Rhodoferax saidenbachensis TaxID=1484693 RepID=A0ABU1ZSG8_9BURK|nr:tetratricopeptide repeat protein [Rhodoferax saidenbachensis]MDR7308343.1 Flp pilus assembly protein TadD [Rhodoferax saidenbachensis]